MGDNQNQTKNMKAGQLHIWQHAYSLYFHCYTVHVVELIITPTTAHIYKIYKILHTKTLKTLSHVLVLRPSSGSYNFLAKVTLEIFTY